MNKLEKATYVLVKASYGNPVVSTVTIMLFYVMFSVLSSVIETLIFGERFLHWLDPFFTMMFIAYAAYSVYLCLIVNSIENVVNKSTEEGE